MSDGSVPSEKLEKMSVIFIFSYGREVKLSEKDIL